MPRMTRIAINGLGRIGRQLLRQLVERGWLGNQVELAAINDIMPADMLAFLLKHDSVHGPALFDVRSSKSCASALEDDMLVVDGREIPCTCLRHRTNDLPWKEHRADVVLECTGMHAWNEAALQGHLHAGARHVIVTAMSPPAQVMIVPGVNHARLDPQRHLIISTGAALTQATAPVLSTLLKAGFDIEEGAFTLLQSLYPTQPVLDSTSRHCWRAGRAMHNLIPGSHASAQEVGLALPELRGRLVSSMFFIPVAGACCVNLALGLNRPTTLDCVLDALHQSSRQHLRDILSCNHDPIVSSDITGNTHSAVVAAEGAILSHQHLLGLTLFYDPETGYARRVLDVLERML